MHDPVYFMYRITEEICRRWSNDANVYAGSPYWRAQTHLRRDQPTEQVRPRLRRRRERRGERERGERGEGVSHRCIMWMDVAASEMQPTPRPGLDGRRQGRGARGPAPAGSGRAMARQAARAERSLPLSETPISSDYMEGCMEGCMRD